MDERNEDTEEKQFPLQSSSPTPNMASSPTSHKEKANSKASGRNAVGQNVTTVMNKHHQNSRNLKKNHSDDLIGSHIQIKF